MLRVQQQSKPMKNLLATKKAFTLIEVLVGLLLISAISMASLRLSSSYLKNTYDRDAQTAVAIENLSTSEEIKAGADTLPRLYSLIQGKNVKVTAVGVGEIALNADGSFTVLSNESYGFSDKLRTSKPTLFKLEIGDDTPNTKITVVVMIR